MKLYQFILYWQRRNLDGTHFENYTRKMFQKNSLKKLWLGQSQSRLSELCDVIVDDDECISCAQVRGVPEPRVTWFKDGEPLTAEKYAITSTDRGKCTLTIANASATDAGRYSCEAVNDRGRVCTLTVVEVVANRKIVEAERRLQG